MQEIIMIASSRGTGGPPACRGESLAAAGRDVVKEDSRTATAAAAAGPCGYYAAGAGCDANNTSMKLGSGIKLSLRWPGARPGSALSSGNGKPAAAAVLCDH